MKKIYAASLIIAFLSLANFPNLFAKTKRDSIDFKLRFFAGDTLRYRIESRDSVIVGLRAPLSRRRYELVEFVCDSVKNGRFYISRTLLQYLAFESSGDVKDVKRETSPWIGFKIYFVIDSAGNRLACGAADQSSSMTSPGGPFQPNLFFPFVKNRYAVGKSWLVESTDILCENAFPPPAVRYASLFKAIGEIDTLDENCSRIEFIKTGQGAYQTLMSSDTLKAESVINGYGRLDISSKKLIPVDYFSTCEIKLSFKIGDQPKRQGKRFIVSRYVLDSFVRKKKRQKN